MDERASAWSVETVGRIAVLSFDNPPMNYLGGVELHQLGKAIDQARRLDPAVLVITSTVPNQFITHFTVEDILAGQERIQERGPLGNQRAQLLLERLSELPQPVIAAMGGDTMGFGFELALACDFRIAQAGDFRIGLPEVRMGIIPGAGGTQRLVRVAGTAVALDMIIRARCLTPDQALARGVVHEVADDACAAAMTLAQELAALPPVAVAMAKSAVYGGRDLDMHSALRVEREASYRAKLAPEATAALSEFVSVPLSERRDWIDRRAGGS